MVSGTSPFHVFVAKARDSALPTRQLARWRRRMLRPLASRRSPVLSLDGGASTDDPLATAAAIEVLTRGGNAADAAVAAAAALQVLKPYATGIGGDCFALFYDAKTRTVRCIDGSGPSPEALTRELFVAGADSGMEATVPGAVKGWFDTLRHCGSGRVSMSEVLAPAVRLARDGFPVGVVNAAHWATYESKLGSLVGGGHFLPVPRAGQLLRNEPLADVLERLGQEGAGAFYKGPVAEAVAAAVKRAGGVLEAADLLRHFVEGGDGLVVPVSTTYRGTRVHTVPFPSHGSVLLEALNILEPFELRDVEEGTYAHLLLEALRLAFADGLAWVAHEGLARDGLMASKEHAKSRHVDIERARQWSEADLPYTPEQSHTVFLVTADEQGNACAFINSNFLGFGCAVVEQYGFAVHCRGRGFSAVAGHPNCAGPCKKPYHTLMPVLVTDDASGDWLAALGTMGGYAQPQVDLQIFLAMLERGLDPQSALDAPRLYIGDGRSLRVDDPLYLEEGFPGDVVEDLRRRGHRIEPLLLSASARSTRSMAHIVTRGSWWDRISKSAVYEGPPILWFGCEPRSDGIAAAAPPQGQH
ncbi:glutathione hydrolase-like YwrD proenzyme [Rhipicephalus sanguineus]|uniref:glutathione hydrolase-like YwrD proenzyme n=1 Tax=Rhipicephalus sanguineus TaxID=34632 RepID=UPI0018938F41|nr:glutathione hydrolase-like YwrD proenzyme [Rhipicephalus sanguineus]